MVNGIRMKKARRNHCIKDPNRYLLPLSWLCKMKLFLILIMEGNQDPTGEEYLKTTGPLRSSSSETPVSRIQSKIQPII